MDIKKIKNRTLSILKKLLNKSVIISFIVGVVVMFGAGYFYLFQYIPKNPCAGNNVGIVKLTGEINTAEDPEYLSVSAPDTIQQIKDMDSNPKIKAIILEVSSPGGVMEPSARIMFAVQRTTKPVIAVIEDVGLSGAYLVASASERIFASRLSSVGSIGVTREFLDTSERDRREGVILYDFSSGPYKGAEKEHSALTEEQYDIVMEDIMKMHEIFVEYVAKNRNIPIDDVKLLATGRTFVGDDALKLGLIDQIGGMEEALDWVRDNIVEEVDTCTVGE
jgi:protease-4